MFRLSAANNQVMPVLKYFEADVSLLGFNIPSVGFLVVKDPNTVLEPQHSTQLLGVIRCNLIQLGCEEFGKVYGFEASKIFVAQTRFIHWFLPRCVLCIIRVRHRLSLHPLHLIGYNQIQ